MFDRSSKQKTLLSQSDLQRISPLSNQFKFFRKFQDPRFSEIQILQNPETREIIFSIEKKINDQSDAFREVEETMRQKELQHEYLLRFIDYSVSKNSGFCTSFYLLQKYYEYPKSDLAKELAEARKSKTSFGCLRLTHLFYQLLFALDYLHSNNVIHGDLQPCFVGYDPKAMVSKLILHNKGEWTANSLIGIQKKNMLGQLPLYQSPLVYSQLKKGSNKFTFDAKKEEIFSVGLMILEAGIGRPIQEIYNEDKGEVDQQKLDKLVNEFQNNFEENNTLVSSVVSSMVSFEEQDRPTTDVIVANIPNYGEVKEFLRNEYGVSDQLSRSPMGSAKRLSEMQSYQNNNKDGSPMHRSVKNQPKNELSMNEKEENYRKNSELNELREIHQILEDGLKNQRSNDYQKQYEKLSLNSKTQTIGRQALLEGLPNHVQETNTRFESEMTPAYEAVVVPKVVSEGFVSTSPVGNVVYARQLQREPLNQQGVVSSNQIMHNQSLSGYQNQYADNGHYANEDFNKRQLQNDVSPTSTNGFFDRNFGGEAQQTHNDVRYRNDSSTQHFNFKKIDDFFN